MLRCCFCSFFFKKKYNRVWGCTRKRQFSLLFDKYWRCRGYRKVETGKHRINSKGFKDLLGVSRVKRSSALWTCTWASCVKWPWLMGSELCLKAHPSGIPKPALRLQPSTKGLRIYSCNASQHHARIKRPSPRAIAHFKWAHCAFCLFSVCVCVQWELGMRFMLKEELS